MPSTRLIDITTTDTEFPQEGAIPVLALCDRKDRDDWIARLIRVKRPFAVASLDAISEEEIQRLAVTVKRRKMPIAILGAYRLIPVFARLKEIAISGCLGALSAIHIRIPTAASPCLCADLALWLCPSVSSESLAKADDNLLVVMINGANGSSTASLDYSNRVSTLSVTINGMTRKDLIPWGDPQRAERDILANTSPASHRWILLMHADDAANAIALATTFDGVSQKKDAPA